MIVRINGVTTEPSVWDNIYNKVDEFSEWLLDKEVEIVVDPVVTLIEKTANKLVEVAGDGLTALIHLLNTYSAEIITLGVVGCAFGFMLGPLWNGGATKWSGRLFVTILVGVIWRMILV